MRLQQITSEEEIVVTADMTRKLFENEPSNKHPSKEEFEDRIRNNMNNGCVVYHFMEEDKILGYAMINMERTPYYLIDFFTDREYRRTGVGKTAFQMLLKELDTETLDLDVFCWNTRGREFWKSLGFEEMAIIMRRQGEKKKKEK